MMIMIMMKMIMMTMERNAIVRVVEDRVANPYLGSLPSRLLGIFIIAIIIIKTLKNIYKKFGGVDDNETTHHRGLHLPPV